MGSEAVGTIDADVLVIGSGVAGLRASIQAREEGVNVLLVSDSRIGLGNNSAICGTSFAVGGILPGSGDSPEVHFDDTLTAGRFVNDKRLVETMVHGTMQQVRDLSEFGFIFAKNKDGLYIWQVFGHSYPRHVGDELRRGYKLTGVLRRHAARVGVQFIERASITKLVCQDRVAIGALAHDGAGNVKAISAKSVILAAGGAGQIFSRTDNSASATGTGYALAYEAGVTLRDMEFIQFYPTGLGKYGARIWPYGMFVKEGAVIRNVSGENVLEKHGLKSPSDLTRDTVSRAVMAEINQGYGVDGCLSVDLGEIPAANYEKLRAFIDNRHYPQRILVAPTVHFCMGGIKIDENCQTGIEGLYAAGEVCCGLHGANRLDGNAIAEALVFGTIAGRNAADRASRVRLAHISQAESRGESARTLNLISAKGEDINELRSSLKKLMWSNAGLMRNQGDLEVALHQMLGLREALQKAKVRDSRQVAEAIELGHMITAAEMVCRAALCRTESRGSHYLTDYAKENSANWMKTVEILKQDQEMAVRVVPIA